MGLNACFAQCCALLFSGGSMVCVVSQRWKKNMEIELAVLELNFKGLSNI